MTAGGLQPLVAGPGDQSVFQRQIHQQLNSLVFAVGVIAGLLLAFEMLRFQTLKFVLKLGANTPKNLDLLIIRAVGDEASLTIGAFQFASWLMGWFVRIYSRQVVVLSRYAAVFGDAAWGSTSSDSTANIETLGSAYFALLWYRDSHG